MTKAEALLVRALPLLQEFARRGVPVAAEVELRAVVGEVQALLAEPEPERSVVVNVYLPAGAPVGKVEPCRQCGGTGELELPRRYLGEKRRAAPCACQAGRGTALALREEPDA